MDADARQRLGQAGEALAAEHLERRGFEIIERNYRTRWGELDIIAYDGRTLAFCEVKTRRHGGRHGDALAAIRPLKRSQVRKIARRWLNDRSERPYGRVLRFDAIGVTFDRSGKLMRLEHVEGAF